MFAAPSPRATVNSKGWIMPGSPAVPQNSAYSDQANAAIVPIETRVSIVAAPWRRLAHAARWNGSAPQTRTGAASVRDNHCQFVNCTAGIIAMAMTGAERTALTINRVRSAWTWASSATAAGSAASPVPASGAGAGAGGVAV